MERAPLNSCPLLALGPLFQVAKHGLSPGAPPPQAPGDGDLRAALTVPRGEKKTVLFTEEAHPLAGDRRPFVGKTGSEDFQDPLGHPPATRPSFRRFSAAPASRQLRVCPPACPYVPPTVRPRPLVMGGRLVSAPLQGSPSHRHRYPRSSCQHPTSGRGGSMAGHARPLGTVTLEPPSCSDSRRVGRHVLPGRTCGWGPLGHNQGRPGGRAGKGSAQQAWGGGTGHEAGADYSSALRPLPARGPGDVLGPGTMVLLPRPAASPWLTNGPLAGLATSGQVHTCTCSHAPALTCADRHTCAVTQPTDGHVDTGQPHGRLGPTCRAPAAAPHPLP